MAKIKRLFILVLLICVNYSKCNLSDMESMVGELNHILGVKSGEFRGEVEKIGDVWFDEFDAGVGYREEVMVTSVSSTIDNHLFRDTNRYKYFADGGVSYLAASTDSLFMLNVLDIGKLRVVRQHPILPSRRIFAFEVFSLPGGAESSDRGVDSQIIVILSVELPYGAELRWYRLTDGKFVEFSSWPIQTRVGRLQYFRHENKNRLMTMKAARNSSEVYYSHIDIYGFTINGSLSDFWLSQRLPGYKVLDLKMCPAYGGVMVALQIENGILMYDYTDENTREGSFQPLPNVTSVGLKNFACFQCGHISYLATAGPNAAIFDFFEGEFQFSSPLGHIDNEEISWIEAIPVDTYRDEVLVLLQLQNSSIVAVAWHGDGFERIPLRLDITDTKLSGVTAIPNGFAYKNQIFQLETELREVPPPAQRELEELSLFKSQLKEILAKQESIFSETESRIENSYLKNPIITGNWQIKTLKSKDVHIEKGVICETVTVGGKNVTLEEFESDLGKIEEALQTLQAKVDKIRINRERGLPRNTTDFVFNGEIVVGNLEVHGTMTVEQLQFLTLNNLSVVEIFQDLFAHNQSVVIKGHKTFPTIDAENLVVHAINGIPVEEIIFDEDEIDYGHIDFWSLKELVLDGDLNFTTINGINWRELVDSTISASETTRIPGTTVVRGTITAQNANADHLNGLKYEDYVLRSETDSVTISAKKTFKNLKVGNIKGIETINGEPISNFILLNGDQNLKELITFENLEILGTLTIDGDITGAPALQEAIGLLNETSRVKSNVMIGKLKVTGHVHVQDTVNNRSWSDFDDLVTEDDAFVEITGKKTFVGNVVVEQKANILTNRVNGHDISEFATLDGDQVFPNLRVIDANVTFGKLERGDLKRFREMFSVPSDGSQTTPCVNTLLLFKVPPVVDQFSFESLHGNLSADEFFKALNESSSKFLFKNLTVSELHVASLKPEHINGMKYEDFLARRISKTQEQELTGNYEIKKLDVKTLKAEKIGGQTVVELEELRKNLDNLYQKLINGTVPINNLTVTGSVSTVQVNNQLLSDVYDPKTMGTVIFETNVTIKNLKIDGLINSKNFNKIVKDAVLKTDTNIVVDGRKTIDRIICDTLDAASWSGRRTKDFLNPSVHQTLTGPITVTGTITVDSFDADRRIGKLSLREIKKKFDYVNGRLVLNGNIEFTSELVTVENLYTNGSIRDVDFNDFHESLIFVNDVKTPIVGRKVFNSAVKFNSLTITDRLNGADLKHFYENAVFINRPASVNWKVVSSGRVFIQGDLNITKKLQARRIVGVDMEELQANAVYLSRPEYIQGTVILENAVFLGNLKLEKLNDVDMSKLLPLHGDRYITGVLRCTNVTAGKLEIEGTVNGVELAAIYENNFYLTGPQNVTGNLVFAGDVTMRKELDVQTINGIDPTKLIDLNDEEPIVSPLVFNNPVTLNGSLRILGRYNGIDVLTWQNTAVKRISSVKQTIFGDWVVDGTARFRVNVTGTRVLNGTNLTELVNDFHVQKVDLEIVVERTESDFSRLCEDMRILKDVTGSQIYKFKYFDYLQIMNFDSPIVSVHHFESANYDYLFVSLESCQLNGFVFNGSDFTQVASVDGFGIIERWITLDYRGSKYFVTLGKEACGRSSGNLWKLTNGEISSLMSFKAADVKKVDEEQFLVLTNGTVLHYTMEDVANNSTIPRNSYSLSTANAKFTANTAGPVLITRDLIYELRNETKNFTATCNVFGTDAILEFEVGMFHRPIFVYYDEKISEDYIFISTGTLSSNYIIQTINAYRASSILMINFDDYMENFLIYIEDDSRIRIYEWRGIENFVYRETIQLRGDKLLTFKLRKQPRLVKKHYLGVIAGSTLEILEAHMYGEKIDIDDFSCRRKLKFQP